MRKLCFLLTLLVVGATAVQAQTTYETTTVSVDPGVPSYATSLFGTIPGATELIVQCGYARAQLNTSFESFWRAGCVAVVPDKLQHAIQPQFHRAARGERDGDLHADYRDARDVLLDVQVDSAASHVDCQQRKLAGQVRCSRERLPPAEQWPGSLATKCKSG